MGSPSILGYQSRSISLRFRLRRLARRLARGFLVFLVVWSLLCYTQPKPFKDHIYWRVSEGVLYARHVTQYDFRPTLLEQQCFDGTAARINEHDLSDSIPEKVHFIWAANSEIPFKVYLAIRAALISTGIISVHLHHNIPLNEDNHWFQLLQPNLTLVHFENSDYLKEVAAYHPETWDVSHQVDVMRLHVLYTEGGIYLDSDAYILRPLQNLFLGTRDVYMGYEAGNRWGLCNGVIMAKAGAPFIKKWLDEYANLDDSDWNYHSVHLPKVLSERHPGDICVLSPSAFFWPMWTKSAVAWMHEPLDKQEATRVDGQIERNGGSLFEDQLIYHAWAHAAEKYLDRLSPEVIQEKDTRFNILMRRFIL